MEQRVSFISLALTDLDAARAFHLDRLLPGASEGGPA